MHTIQTSNQPQSKYTGKIAFHCHFTRFSLEQIIVGYCLKMTLEEFENARKMIDPDWFLPEEHFFTVQDNQIYEMGKGPYNPSHPAEFVKYPVMGLSRLIYEAITQQAEKGIAPSYLPGIQEIINKSIGPNGPNKVGIYALMDIRESGFAYILNFKTFLTYCKAMQENHMQRKFRIIADELRQGSIASPTELKELADQIIFPSEEEEGLDLVDENLAILQEEEQAFNYKMKGIQDPNQVSWGIAALDNAIGGMLPGDLHIVAARTGMGKSSFARQVVAFNAESRPVAFFTSEQSRKEIKKLYACYYGKVNSLKLRTRRYDKADFAGLQKGLSQADKLFKGANELPRSRGLTMYEISDIADFERKVSILCQESAVMPLVVLDYIGLMDGPKKITNKTQEISFITKSLKKIAAANGGQCVILALSQLNRETEKQGSGNRPLLKNLRNSDSIGFDANGVLFLFRPEYYDQLTDENGESTEGLAEVIIGKARGGSQDQIIKTQFIREYGGEFRDWPYGSNAPFSLSQAYDETPPVEEADNFQTMQGESPF